MNEFLLYSILVFVVPCWIINGSLNLLYPLKKHVAFVRMWDKPFDARITLGGQRLLGESTTWLGLLLSVLIGTLFAFFLDDPYMILLGLCVFFGHALGSFIKRRLNVPDGHYMPVIDHGDYIILAGIVFLALNKVSLAVVIISLLITLLIQPIVCFVAFYLGIRKYKL